jgi:hypothetical protein
MGGTQSGIPAQPCGLEVQSNTLHPHSSARAAVAVNTNRAPKSPNVFAFILPPQEKPLRPLDLRIIILMEVPVDLAYHSIYCMNMMTVSKATTLTFFALVLATAARSQTTLPEWVPAQFSDLSLAGDSKANFPALWDSEIKASGGATTIKEAHVMTRTDSRGLVISTLGSKSLCKPIKGDPATGEVWSCPTKLIITNFQQQPVSVVQDLCFLPAAENTVDPINMMAFAVDNSFTNVMAQTYFQGALVQECSITIAVPTLPDAQDPMTYLQPN